MKISGYVIVYNEEKNIEGCLESLKLCDEIIVIDSFSSDNTPKIITKFASKNKHISVIVKNRKFTGFVDQKNYALKIAKNEWLFNLDADERISPELLDSLKDLKRNYSPQSFPNIFGFSMNRKNFYIDQWIQHCGWYPDTKVRLFHKDHAKWEGQLLHETVGLNQGMVQHLKGDLIHYSFLSISDHLKKIDKYTTISARQDFEKGKYYALYFIVLKMITTFLRSFVVKKGFLDGQAGLIISIMSSYHTWLKYIKLWYLHKEKSK